MKTNTDKAMVELNRLCEEYAERIIELMRNKIARMMPDRGEGNLPNNK